MSKKYLELMKEKEYWKKLCSELSDREVELILEIEKLKKELNELYAKWN